MVKFKIKNCLTAFRNLVRSLTCCNSNCCSQKVEMLSDETIQKIQNLQDQLESVLKDVHLLKQSSPVSSTSSTPPTETSPDPPVFV